MKTLFLLGFIFIVATRICTAGTSGFAVDLVTPSHATLIVDGAWQTGTDCLQVKVSVQEGVTDAVLKAYFYGTDGMLLQTVNKPPIQGDGQGRIISPPTLFEKGKKYEVVFGIPRGAEKWRRAIIVFGKPGEYAAKIYPKDDLAKFDYPEKASDSVSAVPAQKGNIPAQDKPIAELQALKAPYDAQVKQEVQQAYDAGVRDLNARYVATLDRSLETAQTSGKLEDAVAIKSDKEAITSGNGVPANDDDKTRLIVKQLRSTYRMAISRLEAERARRLQPLQASFARSLDALVISLTKEGKLAEALAVKKAREDLAVEPAPPPMLGKTSGTVDTKATEVPPANTGPAPTAASPAKIATDPAPIVTSPAVGKEVLSNLVKGTKWEYHYGPNGDKMEIFSFDKDGKVRRCKPDAVIWTTAWIPTTDRIMTENNLAEFRFDVGGTFGELRFLKTNQRMRITPSNLPVPEK